MYLGALKAQRLSEKRDNQVNTYMWHLGGGFFFFKNGKLVGVIMPGQVLSLKCSLF